MTTLYALLLSIFAFFDECNMIESSQAPAGLDTLSTQILGAARCQLGVKNSIYKMLDPGRMGALPLPSAVPSIYLPTGAARILRT